MLRDEGMGKQVMEPRIRDEVNMFCERFIEPHLGEPISLSTLNMATCNVISGLIFGGRSDYDDPKFNILIKTVDKFFSAFMKAGMTKNIPFARFFRFSGLQDITETNSVIFHEMEGRFLQRKAAPDLDDPKNIFDYFIRHQTKIGDTENAFKGIPNVILNLTIIVMPTFQIFILFYACITRNMFLSIFTLHIFPTSWLLKCSEVLCSCEHQQ